MDEETGLRVAPAGAQGNVAPQDGARRNVAPAGAQGNVAPAGAQGNVAPAGAQGNVAPAGAQGTVAPAGARGDVAPQDGAQDRIMPGIGGVAGAADPRRARLRIALAAREEAIGARRARREALLARLRAGLGKRQDMAAEDEAAADALEAFLARLDPVAETGEKPPQPARLANPVLPLARRGAGTPPAETATETGAAGLARLPGAGPGLVATLIRAGIPDLATLAALGPDGLAERLGPLARLIDLGAWLDFARAEAASHPDLPAAG
jgi:hypothetical protein